MPTHKHSLTHTHRALLASLDPHVLKHKNTPLCFFGLLMKGFHCQICHLVTLTHSSLSLPLTWTSFSSPSLLSFPPSYGFLSLLLALTPSLAGSLPADRQTGWWDTAEPWAPALWDTGLESAGVEPVCWRPGGSEHQCQVTNTCAKLTPQHVILQLC